MSNYVVPFLSCFLWGLVGGIAVNRAIRGKTPHFSNWAAWCMYAVLMINLIVRTSTCYAG